jgi:hypothetical protein
MLFRSFLWQTEIGKKHKIRAIWQNSKPQAFGKLSLPLLVTYKLIAIESLRVKNSCKMLLKLTRSNICELGSEPT